ncbi:MAG: hypothetical protein JW864_17905 [Spirochaetes bacterium]|nr:hypothetical protein [Spirochaetota bacterium]
MAGTLSERQKHVREDGSEVSRGHSSRTPGVRTRLLDVVGAGGENPPGYPI